MSSNNSWSQASLIGSKAALSENYDTAHLSTDIYDWNYALVSVYLSGSFFLSSKSYSVVRSQATYHGHSYISLYANVQNNKGIIWNALHNESLITSLLTYIYFGSCL